MKTLVLHGSLAEQFGDRFDFHHPTAQGVVKGIAVQTPGMQEAIREGRFHLVWGSDQPGDGLELDEESMHMPIPSGEVHLIPVIEGRDSGFFNIVIGIALVAVSFIPGVGVFSPFLANLAFGIGSSLILSGISQLLAPSPDLDSSETDKKASFLLNSKENRTRPGNPVPLVFGRMRVGGPVFSIGFDTEELLGQSDDGTESDKFYGNLIPTP